jgi:ribose 1,5-bisphosphokinase
MRQCPGHVVLVVGPSGAGKDSILRGAQARLAANRSVAFPRRVITRRADINAEDHDVMSEMAFSLALAAGDFALLWRAHGLNYGIPITIEDDLKQGRIVVFNASRTIVGEALMQYGNVTVAEIDVSPDVLVERIVMRGRETRDEAILRVNRQVPTYPPRARLHCINNDGELGRAVSDLCALIGDLDDSRPDPGRHALDNEHQQEDRDDRGGGLVIVEHFK